jgi:hypothetical protein
MEYDAAVLERVARRFRRDIWSSVVAEAVEESGIEVREFGPVLATAFGELPEVHSLNQIQGAAEPGAIEEGHLTAAVEWMRAREVDYRVPVAQDRPGAGEAETWLHAHGYERGTGWFKFVRDGSPPDLPESPEVVIYELGLDEADGEGLCAIAAEALGLPLVAETLFFSLPHQPGWRCYTAAVDLEEGVVAAGALLIDGGIAQLGPATTLEHRRGHGCDTALLRRRLLDAAEAGCHTVFAELGEREPGEIAAAHRNLRRAGFKEAYASHNWQRPALHPAGVF